VRMESGSAERTPPGKRAAKQARREKAKRILAARFDTGASELRGMEKERARNSCWLERPLSCCAAWAARPRLSDLGRTGGHGPTGARRLWRVYWLFR